MSELPKGRVEFGDPSFREVAKKQFGWVSSQAPALRARIAELEGKLAEAEAVQAEAAEMAESALSALDGDGELALVGGYLGDIAALNDPPSAQALTRLVEAAKTLHRHRNWKPRFEGDVPDPPGVLSMAINGVVDAYDAYLAARAGRGEGEQMLGIKKDLRPRKGSWAPGDYQCLCYRCMEYFWGHKRAVTCADCAYGETSTHPPAPAPGNQES